MDECLSKLRYTNVIKRSSVIKKKEKTTDTCKKLEECIMQNGGTQTQTAILYDSIYMTIWKRQTKV